MKSLNELKNIIKTVTTLKFLFIDYQIFLKKGPLITSIKLIRVNHNDLLEHYGDVIIDILGFKKISSEEIKNVDRAIKKGIAEKINSNNNLWDKIVDERNKLIHNPDDDQLLISIINKFDVYLPFLEKEIEQVINNYYYEEKIVIETESEKNIRGYRENE